MPRFMQLRTAAVPRSALLVGVATLLSTGLMGALTASPVKARGEELYKLETTCTIKRGPVQSCVVKAVDEGEATVYTHKVGKQTVKVRISDSPVSMSVWDEGRKSWTVLSSAGARFSTNTICFNDRDLCVVNPNYLNSVRQEKSDALAGRDLVGVKFSSDGRVSLTCYDEACEEVQ